MPSLVKNANGCFIILYIVNFDQLVIYKYPDTGNRIGIVREKERVYKTIKASLN